MSAPIVTDKYTHMEPWAEKYTWAYFHVDDAKQIYVRMPGTTSVPLHLEHWDPAAIDIPARCRLLGSRENTELIIDLFRLREEGQIRYLQLASPSLIRAELKQSPYLIPSRLEQLPNLPASQGGWHEVLPQEIVSYEMLLCRDDPVVLQAMFDHHVLAPHLRFLPTRDELACAAMIGEIRDPRWFSDPKRPGKLSRLVSYLGAYHGHDPQLDRLYRERFQMTRRAWAGDYDLQKHVLTDDELVAPGNFVWRKLLRSTSHWRWEQATRHFLRFLTSIWLQTLNPEQRHDTFFIPEYFFTDSGEAEAYREHLQQCR